MLSGFKQLKQEVAYIQQQDPAMQSAWEVLFCSAGLHALMGHRVAHQLWQRNHHFFARLLAHWVRFLTGIEIHPAAVIGNFLFIDHGMGIVIGETAVIGDYVTLFHGVTLGGTGHAKGAKRHPSVHNNVVIGAGATILGHIELGEGCKVGAGAVVLKSVPPYTTVVGIPAVVLANRHA